MSSKSSQPYSQVPKNSMEDNDSFLEKQETRFLDRSLCALTVFKAWDFLTILEVKLDRVEMHSFSAGTHTQQQPESFECIDPSIRRSWRSLNVSEKRNYIDAVKCLESKSSYMVPNTTLYDDFTWIHIKDGNLEHFAAGNLPWHRLHLHLYEHTLRAQCGYSGNIVYWDWEAESQDPFHSDIFDPEIGFGGNGNTTGPYMDQTHGDKLDEDRCVIDGPFKDLTVSWYAAFPIEGPMDIRFKKHCLTRSFAPNFEDLTPEAGTFTDIAFTPARVEEILALDDYNEFNFAMEYLHTWLPKAIMGDFATLSATNDPLFYLHLANIDRIWWKWQQKKPQNLMKYGGPGVINTELPSSLNDPIPFATFPGMPRTLQAKHLMKTESDLLCYRY